ncbi:MAG: peptidase T [Epulopiscium sp.]|nr:peptidase T [Candidatus Epulonipiscium sp.]
MKSVVANRFCNYVKIHTSSDSRSDTVPSTLIQLGFARLLAEECKSIGLTDISLDTNGYVMATLPKNCNDDIPTIGFIAHMDTSPDASGDAVNPRITENYNGEDISLNGITLSPKEFPSLLHYIGDTIITSDGTTLLGADDKAGIAEILTAMEYLIAHPEIKHGTIRIAFTPDEEIGRGADHFDVNAFGADFAYTVDGGKIGELEYENFNAARADIQIKGKSVHPGTAKNIMINASLLASEIISALPKNETPATTEGYEGFFHVAHLEGSVSSASLSIIIRDFDKNNFEARKSFLQSVVAQINASFAEPPIFIRIRDEYFNMKSVIENHMHIVDLAKKAMTLCNITPSVQPIRGGTDGARLSFMNLPCPNIFTGGHNFHGPFEFIPVSSMEKAVQVLVTIVQLSAQQS